MNDITAFPVTQGGVSTLGMTLRDYFAAQVLASIAQHFPIDEDAANHCAESCYLFANAMLKARDK